ncbi:hypothetical protein ASD21_10850 [Caulobacter sp. Root1455]|uniref:hypothetical protein n=1 Tax=unclassified Caulobacter TaxID=2648921 RepID=UPI0006F58EF5|nr:MULTISPECIES: hypothetical protein [unclassified Caulobacter]KQY35284.1 hypothetical protein ASD38_01575 [Caulobacter sp. Root487D2Y]KQY93260.1 hypothetical protein ASD21_10850 [Caulobacter sp. Root1455]
MISFSADGYAAVLRAGLDAGYVYSPVGESLSRTGKTIALRHDVDFDLDYARRMGEIEAGLGVRSTYFVLMGCDFYAATDAQGRAAINAIVDMGHEVGLHWDSSYIADAEAAVDRVRRERDLLSAIAGKPVVSASQHVPTDSAYFDIESLFEVEAYSAAMRERFTYVADSSMRWRAKTPLDLFAEGGDVQFNAHPVWWIAEGETADDKLRSLRQVQAERKSAEYERFIGYMNHVLANRDAYDRKFAEARA